MGRPSLSGLGFDLWWSHTTSTWDLGLETKAFGEGFRADAGFVPQVGFRELYAEVGRTWHPKGFLSRVRTFAFTDPMWNHAGGAIRHLFAAGVGMDGRWSSFARVWLYDDRWRVAEPGSGPLAAPPCAG